MISSFSLRELTSQTESVYCLLNKEVNNFIHVSLNQHHDKKKQPDKCIYLVDWSATIFTYFTVDGQRTMTVCVKHIRCAGARKSLFRFADKMKKLTKTNVSFIASMWVFFNSWEMFDIDYMYRWTVFRQRVYWCSSMATFHYDVNMMSTFYEINMHTVLKNRCR